MIKRHLLQPMIPGTIHPLHHQLSLHPRLDPYLLNPFHHALPLPMMDTTSIEKRIGNSSSNNIDVISRNNNDNNNRPSSTRPLRSFLIEDILKHSPKRSHVPPSETAVTGATTLSCDSPPLPPASIRNLNKHHRASSDRDSQDSIPSSTTNNRKSPKKEPESTSSTPSPKSSTTSSEYNNNNNNLTATSRESHKLLPDTKGKDPNLLCNPLSSLDGKDVVWPAWVYCTRYSDRPSSGPRSRRSKKAKAEKKAADEKRPRTAFTAEQLARLKQEFQENKYLTEKRRQDLARDLKLNESQIKIWFQNKRAKIKKTAGSRNILALHLMAQGLYNHSTASMDDEDEEREDIDMDMGDEDSSTRTSE